MLVSILWVLAYRFINPPITFLMILRNIQAEKEAPPMRKQWVSIEDMSPNMQRAALGGEDERFFEHFGFELHPPASLPAPSSSPVRIANR